MCIICSQSEVCRPIISESPGELDKSAVPILTQMIREEPRNLHFVVIIPTQTDTYSLG